MIYLLLSLFISGFSFSAEKLELLFPQTEVKQGSILAAQIKVNTDTAQSLDLQKLKGSTIGKVIYFYSFTPLLRKDGSDKFEADAKVIFAEVPKENSVRDLVAGKEIEVSWNEIKVQPVESPQGFVFANFEVPSPLELMKWIFGAIVLLALGVLGYKFYKKALLKKELKNRRQNLAKEILGAKNYESIVEVWKKKRVYLKEFPKIEEPFEEFELVLFKYQFKQSQSEREKNEVFSAYEAFINSIKGGIDGI